MPRDPPRRFIEPLLSLLVKAPPAGPAWVPSSNTTAIVATRCSSGGRRGFSRVECFGSPLELSRVTWVKPVLVCEVRFLNWTSDGLLRQVAYEGLRADKPAAQVRRARPA